MRCERAARLSRVGGVLALCALAACGGPDRPRTIKLAHGLPPSHPVHEAMEFFAQEVRRGSRGTLRVHVHPSEQLGTERECLELLQIGSLGMTKVSASVLESFAPAYAVLSLPYLFRDDRHRLQALRSDVGARILEAGIRQGLRGLAYYDAGSRSFYSTDRPVRRPADLRGLKVRTQESPLAMRMVAALGGAPTPIAWGELYTALQQGVVDAAENNPPSFHLSRHFEVARYYSLDEHTATPDVLVIAESLWSELSEAERRLVRAAADASARLQIQLWQEATAQALDAVRAAGVEVFRPDQQAFAAAVSVVYDEYLDRAGRGSGEAELLRLLRAIRTVE